MIRKIKHFVVKRKVLSFLLLILIGGGIYGGIHFFTPQKTETRYILSSVQKGTLINSVTGSGQISVSTQVDVKAKGSGDVLSVLVKNGQEVKNGETLVQLNARDALQTVRDAQTSLESAQLSLEKLKSSITPASITQSENSVVAAKTSLEKLKLSQEINFQKAQETKQKAEDSSSKAYEDALSSISDVFLDLPTIMSGLHDVLYSEDIGKNEVTVDDNQENSSALINSTDTNFREALSLFQKSALQDYQSARRLYETNFDTYKATTRYSDFIKIESLLNQTIETTKSIAQAAKSELNYLDSWVDYRSKKSLSTFSTITEYQSDLGVSLGKVNSHVSSLVSLQRTLKDNREAITNAERDLKQMAQNNPLDIVAAEASLQEKEEALATLKKGVDPLDIRSQEITIQQRRIALADAQGNLSDYTVRAPFDGVVAKIDLRKGESVSNGGTVATIITKQKIAEISLNEVDAAKIKVGQKATLTFDAVEDLTITGQVGEIDALGTVNQGVVSYNVKILFDTQDDRIKSGMTASATIVTDVKTDVLMVENGAIKTQGNASYVEMLDGVQSSDQTSSATGVTSLTPPRQQSITTGLANDTQTEVISGLKEGDQVVVRTITPTAMTNKTTTQAPSLLGGSTGGANRAIGGGGNFRAP